MNIKKDTRNKLWQEIEYCVKRSSSKKDKNFSLFGKWKKFAKKQDGYEIFAVDGKWIRNNLCCYFGHGGHGMVHEFIPMNEIWISTHHYNEGRYDSQRCDCKTRTKNQKVSKNYFDSATIHEIEENKQMKKGKNFWFAHQLALQKEIKAGLLKDSYTDI